MTRKLKIKFTNNTYIECSAGNYTYHELKKRIEKNKTVDLFDKNKTIICNSANIATISIIEEEDDQNP